MIALPRQFSGWTVKTVVYGCTVTVYLRTIVFHADILVKCVVSRYSDFTSLLYYIFFFTIGCII